MLRLKETAGLACAILLLLTAAACGGTSSSAAGSSSSGSAAATSQTASSLTASAASSQASGTGSSAAASAAADRKILVAYFSCTGNTRGIAETAAAVMNADLYEIQAAEPYSSDDLNYNNNQSRATREQNDPSVRPQISGSVSNMADYDIIFLGYPIWWDQAPRIISTFLESYDFSGKTIVPFCTSISSGVGTSSEDLHSLCSAKWLNGTRLAAGASSAEISAWIGGLGLNIPGMELAPLR